MSANSTSAGSEDHGGIVKLFFMALLLLLFAAAVLSYSPTDAPILYGGTSGEVSNWIGWAGAMTAHLLFLHLGLAVYLLLFLIVIRVVRSVLGEVSGIRPSNRWQGFFAGLLILCGALLLFGLGPEMFDEVLPSLGLGHKDAVKSGLSGGVIGQYFAAPRSNAAGEGIFRHLIGSVGCAIVGFSVILGGLLWLYWAEWKELIAGFLHRDYFSEDEKDAEPLSPSAQIPRRMPLPPRQELFTAAASPAPAAPAAPPQEPAVDPFAEDEEEETPTAAALPKTETTSAKPPQETDKTPEDDLFDEDEEEEEKEVPKKPDLVFAPVAERSSEVQTTISRQGQSVAAVNNSGYVLPPLTMLSKGNDSCGEDPEELTAARDALEQTLEDFGIRGWVSDTTTGPRITRFEVTLEPGVNVRKVEQIADNIAMNLKAQSVRILAPIPGRPVVGVEISNSKASAVFMRSVMESEQWQSGKAEIPIALGKDVSGKPVVLDIASAPHMLIAGSTGTGKSVCSNSLIMSLLFRFRPDELKLIMVDPKVVEFDVYKNLPHLLTPVINDSTKVPVALRWAVNEMEKRYRILAAARVKKISEFNSRPIPETPVLDDDGVQIPDRLPVLLVIIDELGDLMMTEAKKDVENSITRIAQKGRAAGVHVVVATQRPSTNVITGVIKANLPTRLCFQVRSLIDSRVVLDSPGGEKLLGKGDMLYMSPSSMHIERVQGSFVPDADIQKVVEFVSAQMPQQFNSAVLSEENPADDECDDDDGDVPWDNGEGKPDVKSLVRKYLRPGDGDVMRQALEVVFLDGKASTSYFQRRLGIGYNRAAELVDQLEARGVLGPPSGSGNKREILVFDTLDIND